MIVIKHTTGVYCDKCGASTWFHDSEPMQEVRYICKREGWIIKWNREVKNYFALCQKCAKQEAQG
jgi:Fe2+ or Zn2+ uptake regulation protein